MNSFQTIKPWEQLWPKDDLEILSICPVCGGNKRELLYDNLVDIVFRVAPGKWTLWMCQKCNSAYLDPRPTPGSIHRAYEAYYTHNSETKREHSSKLGRLRLLRRALANGYLNYRYGTGYQPASFLGLVFAAIFRSQREALDAQFRWLPRHAAGKRLLDVGCGNGGFLMMPRDAGWHVTGVDTDSNAVSVAKELELEVYQGTIDTFGGSVASFDAVTISHVIEHVHDPKEMLATAYRLLKPGGTLYIDTPNIESLGHRLFGVYWFGLEAPRHLVLLTRKGLLHILKEIGFIEFKFKNRRLVNRTVFKKSLQLMKEDQSANKGLPLVSSVRARLPFRPATRLEFITVLAKKPGS